MDSTRRARCEDLICRHFDAGLTVAEENELAVLLEDSLEARELFARFMRLEGEVIALAMAGDDFVNPGSSDVFVENASRAVMSSAALGSAKRFLAWVGWTVLAIVVVVTVYNPSAFDFGLASDGPMNLNATPSQSVARFSRLVDVKWPGETDPSVGEAIFPGTIELNEGLAEIEFDNGAIVIVEGPARLDLPAGDRAFLHYGRLRSIVPLEAYGFTVESADVKVVDLGTEFGFEVDPEGLAEIHVFDGEVEMFEGQDRKQKRLLAAGQAIQFESTGWRKEIPADQRAFVDVAMLEARAESYVARLREEVRNLSSRHRALLRDRRLRESEVRCEPSLVELRKEADQARSDANKVAKSDATVARAMKQRKEIQKQIDQHIQSRLKKTHAGKKLLSQLEQVEKELEATEDARRGSNKYQDSQRSSRKNRRKSPGNRDLNRRRLELRAMVRKEGGKLRKSDRKVRELVSRLNKSKRKLDETLRKSKVSKLRRAAEAKRKEFLAAQNRVLQNDGELVRLRKRIDETSSLLRQTRRRIHQARKQNAEDFLLDGEIVEPELGSTDVQSVRVPANENVSIQGV